MGFSGVKFATCCCQFQTLESELKQFMMYQDPLSEYVLLQVLVSYIYKCQEQFMRMKQSYTDMLWSIDLFLCCGNLK